MVLQVNIYVILEVKSENEILTEITLIKQIRYDSELSAPGVKRFQN